MMCECERLVNRSTSTQRRAAGETNRGAGDPLLGQGADHCQARGGTRH